MKPSHVGQHGMFVRQSDRAERCGNCANWLELSPEQERSVLQAARQGARAAGEVARLGDLSARGWPGNKPPPGLKPAGSRLRFAVSRRLVPDHLVLDAPHDPRLDTALGMLAYHQLGRCRFGSPPPEHGSKSWGGLTHRMFTCSRWANPHVRPDGGAAQTELPGEAMERLAVKPAPDPLEGVALSVPDESLPQPVAPQAIPQAAPQHLAAEHYQPFVPGETELEWALREPVCGVRFGAVTADPMQVTGECAPCKEAAVRDLTAAHVVAERLFGP